MPRISVVIPLYNKEREIERTIAAVLAQTFIDYEILVINDGSTDKGPALIERISDKRIRMIHTENRGASSARNTGIEQASSELIALLDADDVWDTKHVETLVSLRERFPEAGLYTTADKILFENGKNHHAHFYGIKPRPWEGIIDNYFLSLMKGTPPVWTSAAAIPKAVFSDIGVFDAALYQAEDSQLWARIAAKYPVAFSWDGPAFHRRDAGNRMMKVKNQFLVDHPEEYIDKILVDPLTCGSDKRRIIHAYNNLTFFQCVKLSFLGSGNWNTARIYLRRVSVSFSGFLWYAYWFILCYILHERLPSIQKSKRAIFLAFHIIA